jgi:GntR family transcriptional regulator
MQLYISPHDGVPIYLQIVNQVKYLIAAGRLAPGEALPPVRKLALQLLINPNTVARAYRELEGAGVLQARQGSGVYVTGGGSPLARREQSRILAERVDALLAEANHLDVDVEDVIQIVRQRAKQLKPAQ